MYGAHRVAHRDRLASSELDSERADLGGQLGDFGGRGCPGLVTVRDMARKQLAPWESPGLPKGLTEQAFTDAVEALRTGGYSGRVQALPTEMAQRTSRLFGTEYPHNRKRIRAAARYPALTDVAALKKCRDTDKTGRPVPVILWADPTPVEGDVVPLAVILPNGYAGSVYNQTGTELTRWVASHAKQDWMWATIAFLPSKGTDVDVLLPTWKALGLG